MKIKFFAVLAVALSLSAAAYAGRTAFGSDTITLAKSQYTVIQTAYADEAPAPAVTPSAEQSPIPMPSPVAPVVIGGQDNIKAMGDAITNLAKNWKALGPIGIASSIIMLVILFLSSNICGNWFGKNSWLIKRAIIVLLGQVLGVLAAVGAGVVWYAAVIGGLISSGGAVAIYQFCIDPFIKKKSAQPTA